MQRHLRITTHKPLYGQGLPPLLPAMQKGPGVACGLLMVELASQYDI